MAEQKKARIQKGKGRGQKIGFPTLNLSIPPDLDCPHGIYAGWVWLSEKDSATEKKYAAAIHFGPIPVFKESAPVLEAHILDAEIEGIPGQATFQIVQFLREIRDFQGIDELVVQIEKDIQATRAALKLAD